MFGGVVRKKFRDTEIFHLDTGNKWEHNCGRVAFAARRVALCDRRALKPTRVGSGRETAREDKCKDRERFAPGHPEREYPI
jgi:hypothetical protein